MEPVIGRKEEKKILLESLHSGEPELVAIYGRRRVGKTYLIRQVYKKSLFFEFSGTSEGTMEAQLQSFTIGLQNAMKSPIPLAIPSNWLQAMGLLIGFTERQSKSKKLVIFFDEFPWICTPKSGFLSAFEYFWNSWASRYGHIKVVICGSAAAWMIQHILNNKGGLHNRITRRIRLMPFSLYESEAYIKQKNLNLNRFQLLQIHMVMGGIPHYLKEIRKAESVPQAIDRICFSKDGLLQDEFGNLFKSLFGDDSRHMAVIRALAASGTGLTRNEMAMKTNLSSGGTITNILDELVQSGFISLWQPYNHKIKESIYKLSDEYSYFYLKFIDGSRSNGKGTWRRLSESQSWKSWSGFAFERACLKHIEQLTKELEIDGYNEVSAWRYHPKLGRGVQIDLLIDRKDFVINICEMKFSEKIFTIDKDYAANLRNKLSLFLKQTAIQKKIHLVLVTSFGLKSNAYEKELVEKSITMDALFQP
jgi:hypothetical protein